MTKNDYDYTRAVLFGAIIGMVFLSFFYVFTRDDIPKSNLEAPQSNFEVVDAYKGCEVVRWTQSNFADYKYFLHCEPK